MRRRRKAVCKYLSTNQRKLLGTNLVTSLSLGHIDSRKKIFPPVQQVMMQKTFDERFDKLIFKEADPSSAGVKAASTGVKFQTKIWVMATANDRMKVIGCASLIHRSHQSFRL